MITIRVLTPEDVGIYRSIRLEGLSRHPDSFGAALEEEAPWPMKDHAGRLRQSTVFGAIGQARLVGVTGFARSPAVKERHKGYLWGMYVRPVARRAGVGAALLEAVIDHARTEVSSIQLTVAAQNDDARRLYERYGFQCYGTEPDALRIGENSIDEILMLKRLDER